MGKMSLMKGRTARGLLDRVLDHKMLPSGGAWAERQLSNEAAIILPRVAELSEPEALNALGKGIKIGMAKICSNNGLLKLRVATIDSEGLWRSATAKKQPFYAKEFGAIKPHQLLQIEAPRELERSSLVSDSLYEGTHFATRNLIGQLLVVMVTSRIRKDDRHSLTKTRSSIEEFRNRGGAIRVIAITTEQAELGLRNKLKQHGISQDEVTYFPVVDVNDPGVITEAFSKVSLLGD